MPDIAGVIYSRIHRKVYNMNIIYKYKLEPLTINKVKIPGRYSILTVAIQRNELYLWAFVDKGGEEVEVEFLVAGTGHLLPENTTPAGDFVGTAVSDLFVWHVFKLV